LSGPRVVELRDSGSGGPQTIRVGEEAVIRLSENPTTGYAWELSQSGAGALRVVENRFDPGGAGIGAAGQRVIRLVGELAGTVEVTLIERRPWESSSGAQQRKTFTIQVQR
jgi:predicted secreted protein